MERVRSAAEAAGRDPSEITAAYNMLVRVGDEQPGNVMTVAGSSAAIAEQLIGFTKLGFTSFNLAPTGPDRLEQIELLGREVLPELRRAG